MAEGAPGATPRRMAHTSRPGRRPCTGLCPSPVATITQHHSPGGLENKVTSSGLGRLQVQGQGVAGLECPPAAEGRPLPGSPRGLTPPLPMGPVRSVSALPHGLIYLNRFPKGPGCSPILGRRCYGLQADSGGQQPQRRAESKSAGGGPGLAAGAFSEWRWAGSPRGSAAQAGPNLVPPGSAAGADVLHAQ